MKGVLLAETLGGGLVAGRGEAADWLVLGVLPRSTTAAQPPEPVLGRLGAEGRGGGEAAAEAEAARLGPVP